MQWLTRFFSSSLGAKVVMAVTGVVMGGFTLVHMAGNLQVFLGAEAFNHYAELLHSVPELLWATRLTLLAAFPLHIAAWLRVQSLTAAARPIGYQRRQASKAGSWVSRAMRVTGPLVLFFLIAHLGHLTTGQLHTDFRVLENAPDAFHNLTTGLKNPAWYALYVVANLGLALHLWHGLFSMTKTLGLHGERQLTLARNVAVAFTVAVAGGNILIATAIITGLVG